MKTKLILLYIVLLTSSFNFINCNDKIILDKDTLFENKQYEAKIKKENNDKEYYLVLFFKSIKYPVYSYEAIKMEDNGSFYTAKFKIQPLRYMLTLNISDGEKFIEDYGSPNWLILKEDSTLFPQTYYEYLAESQKNVYMKIFDECRAHYPKDLGIFLIKWYYEGTNDFAKKENLLKDLNYIENNFPQNGDYYLTLTVGYKLLNEMDKFNESLKNLSTQTSQLLNNDRVTAILNDILQTRINKSMDVNSNKDVIIRLIENNSKTYFSIRRLSSLISNDLSNVKLLNDILESEKFYYYKLLLKKYQLLINNSVTDSSLTIKEIENIFENAYKNIRETFLEGKNYGFHLLPRKQIFYEIKYLKSFKNKDYRNAINIILEQNNVYDKDETYNIATNYGRISDIYLKYLYNLDSSLSYAIKYYDLIKDKDAISKLENIKNTYFKSEMDLNTWIDSIKLDSRKNKNSNNNNTLINNSTLINLDNNISINLNQPLKKIILFFYSTTCGPCKIIFNQIKKNKDFIKSNKFNIVYISAETKNIVEKFKTDINFNFDYVKNGDELRKLFKVVNEPVLVYINENGEVLNKQNGVSEKWDLQDSFNTFFK